MLSIRGAITIDEDTRENVLSATRELLNEIIKSNNILIKDIVSIIFTCTDDIKSSYPAPAAREMGIVNASLMCLNEMYVIGSLRKCIRVMVLVNMEIPQKNAVHIYLRGASVLRPDLKNTHKVSGQIT